LLLYYITDRSQFPGDEAARSRRLLETIRHAVGCGVDYIQLREKDLAAGELERLAGEVAGLIRNLRTGNSKLKTGFLINSRTDVALACGANGVQLRSNDISAIEVRRIWAQSSQRTIDHATIGVSCHTPDEVSLAAAQGADFAVFGPVFEKNPAPGVSPAGLDRLRQVCRHPIPVLAIGGVTLDNAESCVRAGAAGIAAIRLFQGGDMARAVGELRDSFSKTVVRETL
jgi:thiamine-phosphate pyrophosphorylase